MGRTMVNVRDSMVAGLYQANLWEI